MSIENIAVGVDLSPESELATMQAMGIARHCGARVVLVHVGVMPDPPAESLAQGSAASAYDRAWRARVTDDRQRLETFRQRLLGQGVELSHVLVDGFADVALADAAREAQCDLIIVGTHGRAGARRFLLGSVAEKTVRLAVSSVLVARGAPHAADGGYRRIVVGTDFSALSDAAIARALELAASDARVRLVHAWSLPAIAGADSPVVLADVRDSIADDAAHRAREVLQRCRSRWPGLSIEMETREEPAHEALIDRAAAFDADLIAVGSHGRRGARRFLLGSVAEVTVRHAPCSVLVARGERVA